MLRGRPAPLQLGVSGVTLTEAQGAQLPLPGCLPSGRRSSESPAHILGVEGFWVGQGALTPALLCPAHCFSN